jgi:hypothetical protein
MQSKAATYPVGCRNKFGMTVRDMSYNPSEASAFITRNDGFEMF